MFGFLFGIIIFLVTLSLQVYGAYTYVDSYNYNTDKMIEGIACMLLGGNFQFLSLDRLIALAIGLIFGIFSSFYWWEPIGWAVVGYTAWWLLNMIISIPMLGLATYYEKFK